MRLQLRFPAAFSKNYRQRERVGSGFDEAKWYLNLTFARLPKKLS